MKQTSAELITSCTITWENCGLAHTDDIVKVITRIMQTEIQIRFYNGYGGLISGRIWPITDQQKRELFSLLDICIHEWTDDDNSVDVDDGSRWQLKVCARGKCLKTFEGTAEPPSQGKIIREMLVKIVGEDNCYFY